MAIQISLDPDDDGDGVSDEENARDLTLRIELFPAAVIVPVSPTTLMERRALMIALRLAISQ